MLIVGIDSGKNTGVAVYDTKTAAFVFVATMPIHRATRYIDKLNERNYLHVFVEDARLRKWIPNSGDRRKEAGRRMGAGSVKRDAAIWEDFLKDSEINYNMVAPIKGGTKWDDATFRERTGWNKRTSEHARDAAALVLWADNNGLTRILK